MKRTTPGGKNPNAVNGPFYRKQKKKFFALPGCPECKLKGRYVEFLPVTVREKRTCPRCKSRLEYSLSLRSAGFLGGLIAVVLVLDVLLLSRLQSVVPLLIFTFSVIFLGSFFLPLTMDVKCVKKGTKK